MLQLDNAFFQCMKNTLQEDFEQYKASFDNEPFRGLRVNTLKTDAEKLASILNIKMTKTPFYDEGFYIDNNIKGLGNHPLHHAGAFYLQEPSAMSAVSALEVQTGDKVLDLCAAPGGKSTQIADQLKGSGLIWSNEIVGSRAKILCSNMERMGITNSVVSNAHPDVLCSKLQGYFDKVLVDAPCSGEGMVRREPNAVTEWKEENRSVCADRQLKILESACKALKNGGVMVYSTCTLSGEENELVIDKFLQSHSEFKLEAISKQFGRPAYTHFCDNPEITLARRILPCDGGEGHFVARLRKCGDEDCYVGELKLKPLADDNMFREFWQSQFNCDHGRLTQIGDSVIILPQSVPDLSGLHILKCGVEAGKFVKNRFQPEHALYMASKCEHLKNVVELDANDPLCTQFLKGAEIPCDKKGYCGVAVNGMVMGFGKASNGMLKNHYPKGLRIL
ncbi:MAG: RsmB/NOP family class I SAM-dependent RNA methyltransferase [Clostridia bacterium]|nr:RsmB/NOP family class I SAM-dependent RNA methyltransferase [Clostridia bacterium]